MASNNADPGRSGGTDDDDDATADDIDLSSFLDDSDSIDGLSFPSASGIKANRVAEAIIGSVAFVFAYGVSAFVDAAAAAYAGLIDGVGGFLVELIGATIGAAEAGVEGAWSASVSEFGVLAYGVALATVLATFYVASWGIDTAREVL